MAEATTLTDAAPPALIRKLDEKLARFEQLREQMSDPAVQSNPQKLIAASKESGQLEPVVEKYRQYKKVQQEEADLRAMLNDPEMRALAESELGGVMASATTLLEELKDEFVAAED